MTPEELKRFMTKHNFNNYTLADLLGVTRQGVDHWTSGTRPMSKTITRLLKVFDKYPQLLQEFAA